MNLFLNKNEVSPGQNTKNIKNRFNSKEVSKTNIKYRNRLTLFNHKKGKESKIILKKPETSKNIKNIIETDYTNNINKLNSEKNITKINNFLSTTVESNRNNIKKNSISSEENIYRNRSNKTSIKDYNDFINRNKALVDLKKRNSLFANNHHNLNQIYGFSLMPKKVRPSLYKTPHIKNTFFTSIPIDNYVKNNKSLSKLLSKTQLRKEYYSSIKLKELKNQVKKFETSEKFIPNEKIIEKYLSSPDRFINKKYAKTINLKKRIKMAQKKCKSKLLLNKNIYTVPSTKSKRSKSLYLEINNIQKESDNNKQNVRHTKYDYNCEKTDKILKNAIKKINLMSDEVTEYLKEIAIEYKKEIGEFTFYNGKGIYSNHLSILKKNDNLLAFMLPNDLVD